MPAISRDSICPLQSYTFGSVQVAADLSDGQLQWLMAAHEHFKGRLASVYKGRSALRDKL